MRSRIMAGLRHQSGESHVAIVPAAPWPRIKNVWLFPLQLRTFSFNPPDSMLSSGKIPAEPGVTGSGPPLGAIGSGKDSSSIDNDTSRYRYH